LPSNFLPARNSLTLRTALPVSSGSTALDVSHMKDGDFAGLGLSHKKYGIVRVKVEGNKKYVVMTNTTTGNPEEIEKLPPTQEIIYFKGDCDFRIQNDLAKFYYSKNGNSWIAVRTLLEMAYSTSQFLGYRFALFNYITKITGGFADFDFFRISDSVQN
jgi:beta-xylosidase